MAGSTAISKTNTTILKEKYDKIINRLSQMHEITVSACKTGGMFTYSPNSPNAAKVDITKATDLAGLLMITGFIIKKREEYDSAIKALELKTAPIFKWLGYAAEDWLHDLKVRVAILTQDEERKLLEGYQAELSKYFSDDDRFDQLMAKLELIP